MDNFKEKYLSFEGRLNRWAYFVRTLQIMLLSIVISLGISLLFGSASGMGKTLTGVWNFVSFCIGITLATRRLHDLNLSGWWQLIGVVPFTFSMIGIIFMGVGAALGLGGPDTTGSGLGLGVFGMGVMLLGIFIGLVFSLYLWCRKGTDGENKYGPDPLQQ